MTSFWLVLFTLIVAFLGLSEALMNMSTTSATFTFWQEWDDFFNIIPAPLIFSFVLAYTNKGAYLKKVWLLIPLYGTLLMMLYLSWTTSSVFSHAFKDAILTPWGFIPKPNLGAALIGIYFLSNQVIYLVLLVHFYLTNKDRQRRQQTKLFIIIFTISSLLTTFTEGFLPNILHIPVFPSAIYLETVRIFITLYVLNKYGLHTFNIDTVSEKLLQLIPSSVVVLNSMQTIELVNPPAETLFHKQKERLLAQPVKQLFLNDEEFAKFESEVLIPLVQNKKESTQLYNAKLLSMDATGIAVDIQAIMIKDPGTHATDILVIFTSIQESLEQANQLQQKVRETETQKTELEKMNKLMIDREIKMVELKKHIEALEKQQVK